MTVACDGKPGEPHRFLQITCTDLYENLDGDWVGPPAPFEGLDGNFSADPCFCDLTSHELTVWVVPRRMLIAPERGRDRHHRS